MKLIKKKCFTCEEWKPPKDFPKRSNKIDGIGGRCTGCINDKVLKRYHMNSKKNVDST